MSDPVASAASTSDSTTAPPSNPIPNSSHTTVESASSTEANNSAVIPTSSATPSRRSSSKTSTNNAAANAVQQNESSNVKTVSSIPQHTSSNSSDVESAPSSSPTTESLDMRVLTPTLTSSPSPPAIIAPSVRSGGDTDEWYEDILGSALETDLDAYGVGSNVGATNGGTSTPTSSLPPSRSIAATPPITDFDKTLQSDVGETAGFDLLTHVASSDPVFSSLTSDDLSRLAHYLSILSFEADERIITKNEPASFCGIVLQGSFTAILSETHSVVLEKGSLVGEMSYYEGGKRTADIISSSTPAVLAMISFSDLQKLQLCEPILVGKFHHILATVCIKKLRKMISQASAASSSATSSTNATTTVAAAENQQHRGSIVGIENSAATNGGEQSTSSASAASPTSGATLSEPKPSSNSLASRRSSTITTVPPNATAAVAPDWTHVQESLFFRRLALKHAAHASNAELVTQAKKETEEAKKRENEEHRKALKQRYKANTLEYKLKSIEKELVDTKEEMLRGREFVTKSSAKLRFLQEALNGANTARALCEEELEEVKSELKDVTGKYEELQKASQDAITTLQAKYDATMKDNTHLTSDLSTLTSSHTQLTHDHTTLLSTHTSLQSETSLLRRELEIARGNLMITQARLLTSQEQCTKLTSEIAEYETQTGGMKQKMEFYQAEYIRITTKLKEMDGVLKETLAQRRRYARDAFRVKKLFKRYLLGNFIKNVRIRMKLLHVMKRVQKMRGVDGKRIGGGGGKVAIGEGIAAEQPISPEIADAKNDATGNRENDDDDDEDSTSNTTSKQQQRRNNVLPLDPSISHERSRFIHHSHKSRLNLTSLITKFDTEFYTFYELPYSMMYTEMIELRSTLDAFFTRNIQYVAQFQYAKTMYEELYREYGKLRESATGAGGGVGGGKKGYVPSETIVMHAPSTAIGNNSINTKNAPSNNSNSSDTITPTQPNGFTANSEKRGSITTMKKLSLPTHTLPPTNRQEENKSPSYSSLPVTTAPSHSNSSLSTPSTVVHQQQQIYSQTFNGLESTRRGSGQQHRRPVPPSAANGTNDSYSSHRPMSAHSQAISSPPTRDRTAANTAGPSRFINPMQPPLQQYQLSSQSHRPQTASPSSSRQQADSLLYRTDALRSSIQAMVSGKSSHSNYQQDSSDMRRVKSNSYNPQRASGPSMYHHYMQQSLPMPYPPTAVPQQPQAYDAYPNSAAVGAAAVYRQANGRFEFYPQQ